jgi:ABC-type oligopeptide transport system substrate-binding subunit
MRKMNRILCVIIAAFVLSALVLSCAAPEKNQPEGVHIYTSFQDIPDVTEDEIKAVEVFREEFGSFVYGVNPSTEAFYNE